MAIPASETANGKKYGSLTIINEAPRKNKHRYFFCRCVCGGKKRVRLDSLRNGSISSCGCYNKQMSSRANTKHGKSGSRLYKIWSGMKSRCFNKNNTSYSNYGGRGISIHKEWMLFEAFAEWANRSGYNDTLTIERVDVNGNYNPDNCTWATMDDQKRNTTVSKRITFRGKTQTMRQWANEINIDIATLCRRFRVGMSVEDALTHKKYAKI